MASHRTKMARFAKLISYDEAVGRLLSVNWVQIPVESVPVLHSNGRVSASKIVSSVKVPNFDRSAVDGFAVAYSDVSGSDEFNPVLLKIAGEIEAGKFHKNTLANGYAYEIYTGGQMPRNADAVVMAEDAVRRGNEVEILKPVRKYENVSRSGEDLDVGQVIIGKGEVIKPQHLASMVAAGFDEIKVYKRINMGILSTGNEIMPKGGTIKNTTQPLLLNYFNSGYMETIDLGVVPDEVEKLHETLKSFRTKDLQILVITGGTSLGVKDIVPDVVQEYGSFVFGGVMIKPGRTISLYEVKGMPVFCISGLPVAALISLEAFLNEYLSNQIGLRKSRFIVRARMSERVANRDAMRSYLRVHLKNTELGLIAEPLRITGSGILSSLLKANGIVVIPENIEGIEEGDAVEVSVIGEVL